MSAVQTFQESWEAFPARTRNLLAAAIAVLAFVIVYHIAIVPLSRSTGTLRARQAENVRKLALIKDRSGSHPIPAALAGKTLGLLSAARVVEALTQAAHANGIQRINFKTGPTSPVAAPADAPAPGEFAAPRENASRMPVTVEIEAQGGDFAAYLDGLAALPMPLSIESFDMKVDKALAPTLRIRMEMEVYGSPA
jgi:hypothetical protein